MINKLFDFIGGVQIPYYKEMSTQDSIGSVALPSQLILPLSQHIGAAAEPIVTVGQAVLKGEEIAKATGYVSAPLHAPTSGTITDIGDYPLPHPSGMRAPCIILTPDGENQWMPLQPHSHDYQTLDPSTLRNIVRGAGIVGLGGAGFPTFIKHNPGPNGHVETLILNGAECEPYITCDDALMRERPEQILAGLKIIKHALNAKRCIIAIEDNKPKAIECLRSALMIYPIENTEVIAIPTIYPAGSEKQLIYTVTGKQVPKDGLPINIGVVCQNAGTCAAVHLAIEKGQPLVSRVVTVSGDVGKPRNVDVPIGMPIDELIQQCGGITGSLRRLIIGGPMMGFAMHQLEIPIVKTSNCVLVDAGNAEHLKPRDEVMPCIRCGSCAEVCPVSLLPQQLYWYSKDLDLEKAQSHYLFDCIECGCCDYVCPSQIPLVQYYRHAKAEIWKRERETQKSDAARERHEFRLFRIEREKEEKAARHKQKKAALKTNAVAANATDSEPSKKHNDPKQAAILAAMERVKAKKLESQIAPKNTDNLTPAQRKTIEEIDKNRKERNNKDTPET